MNRSESKVAKAIGGKTARACESCLKKRARWFCTADDAFLCQSCDATVHSANLLASRHERVRLKTSSNSSPPAWHQGFTRKARTPRPSKLANNHVLSVAESHSVKSEHIVLVPETNGEDPSSEENEEDQFLCRVPVFDPFGKEFCTEMGGDEEEADNDHEVIESFLLGEEGTCHDLNLEELMSCDLELPEFTADVESLLGTGNEEDRAAREIDDLRIGTADFEDELSSGKGVKIEELDKDDGMSDEVQAVIECHFDPALDMELNFDFDYAYSTSTGEDEDNMKKGTVNKNTGNYIDSGNGSPTDQKRMLLKLDHEAVIAAWATQGSPWTNGVRPQFNLDEFKVECLGGSSHDLYGLGRGRLGVNDAGRKERVSRYREKRRTRLFSKKIRYEVRKLNAEKRPRMKGRFVKRTSISGSSLPYLMCMNK